jgi:hypothetical protein
MLGTEAVQTVVGRSQSGRPAGRGVNERERTEFERRGCSAVGVFVDFVPGQRGITDNSLSSRQALASETPQTHVFLPGHRLIVQVQSSWFPVYDRNPQTFVKNIAFAAPGDFRAARSKSLG